MPLDLVLPIRVRRIEQATSVPPPASGDLTHGAGFTAGYEAGRLRAEFEGSRERAREKEQARALVAKLEKIHQECDAVLEEHLPDLIQGALARVFRKHPFTAAEITGEVTALLRDMAQAGRLTLECAPAESDALRRELEASDAMPSGLHWKLEGNPALASGEFVLKSDLGDVDGRHSSRLRQIQLALKPTP